MPNKDHIDKEEVTSIDNKRWVSFLRFIFIALALSFVKMSSLLTHILRNFRKKFQKNIKEKTLKPTEVTQTQNQEDSSYTGGKNISCTNNER